MSANDKLSLSDLKSLVSLVHVTWKDSYRIEYEVESWRLHGAFVLIGDSYIT